MRVEQFLYTEKNQWGQKAPSVDMSIQLVLVFGETSTLKNTEVLTQVKKKFPNAIFFGCSTAGEIFEDHVFNDSMSMTTIQFESSKVELRSMVLNGADDSHSVGQALAKMIPHSQLKHVLVLSPGLNVNGTELTRGIGEILPAGVSISGGLAGDNDRFSETLVIAGDAVEQNLVAILGFYGEELHLGTASMGGWDAFGPERLITKAHKNILYELDGKSALQLYKSYLGPHAKDLPGSALLFPLKLKIPGAPSGLVRTVLGIDEATQSMIFAGDLPQGSYAQFMMANFDRVIDGAVGAAQETLQQGQTKEPDLALLISCVGRKIILKQRVDEEIEGVRSVLGEHTKMTGFYSYGEISPLVGGSRCELHNQTMTITTITESKKDAA